VHVTRTTKLDTGASPGTRWKGRKWENMASYRAPSGRANNNGGHYYLAVRGPLSDKIGTLQLLARASRLLLLADVDKVPELVQVLVVGRRQLASDDSARQHTMYFSSPGSLGNQAAMNFANSVTILGAMLLSSKFVEAFK